MKVANKKDGEISCWFDRIGKIRKGWLRGADNALFNPDHSHPAALGSDFPRKEKDVK